jgi:hypothetical protein
MPFEPGALISRSLWVIFIGEWGVWTHAVLPVDDRLDMPDQENITGLCDLVGSGEAEIRYVLPTSPEGPHRPFCQLCKDHLDSPADDRDSDQPGQADRLGCPAPVVRQRAGVVVPRPARRPHNPFRGAGPLI